MANETGRVANVWTTLTTWTTQGFQTLTEKDTTTVPFFRTTETPKPEPAISVKAYGIGVTLLGSLVFIVFLLCLRCLLLYKKLRKRAMNRRKRQKKIEASGAGTTDAEKGLAQGGILDEDDEEELEKKEKEEQRRKERQEKARKIRERKEIAELEKAEKELAQLEAEKNAPKPKHSKSRTRQSRSRQMRRAKSPLKIPQKATPAPPSTALRPASH